MFKEIYKQAKEFKKKYPFTVAWRIRSHCKIIAKHLEDSENIKYVFVGQKNDNILDIITTYVIVVTDKRIILGEKRLFFGYFFISITSDMFNDVTIKMGILWGRCVIDTVKEKVVISNLSKKSLPEIETNITKYALEAKGEMPNSKRV